MPESRQTTHCFYTAAFTAMVSLLSLLQPATAQSWQRFEVASDGIKPSLALNAEGIPYIAYMTESSVGYLNMAVWDADADSFAIERVVDGYFFGPAALAIDADGHPHVNYHDHTTGNQQHVFENDQGWVNEPIHSSGHDGWDNSIVVDPQGIVHTSSIDPGLGGVEYAHSTSTPGVWTVESIGSSRMAYGYGTALAIDPVRIPHIAYFDTETHHLLLASRTSGWEISEVDTVGEVGRFPSLKIDAEGGIHLTYFRDLENSMGLIEYAHFDGTDWTYSTIDKLNDVLATTAGHMTSLALDADGRPHVAYGDQKVVRYAYRDGEVWETETVADVHRTLVELGQLASLAIDDEGIAHVAYFEDTSRGQGGVRYARRGAPAILASEAELPPSDIRMDIYPNPTSAGTTIDLSGIRATETELTIFDILGREVYSEVHSRPGPIKIRIEEGRLSGGWYLVSMRTSEELEQRALIVQ